MEFLLLLFSFCFSFLIDIPLASFPGALLFVFGGTDLDSGIQTFNLLSTILGET